MSTVGLLLLSVDLHTSSGDNFINKIRFVVDIFLTNRLLHTFDSCLSSVTFKALEYLPDEVVFTYTKLYKNIFSFKKVFFYFEKSNFVFFCSIATIMKKVFNPFFLDNCKSRMSFLLQINMFIKLDFRQKKENKLTDFLRRRLISSPNVEITSNVVIGNEPQEETVIERIDDVVKSVNDVYSYR